MDKKKRILRPVNDPDRRSKASESGLLKRRKGDERSPITVVLENLYDKYKDNHDGELANYIPELEKVDPNSFSISLATLDGKVHHVGTKDEEFTIMSCSKPFVYGMALQEHGAEAVQERVGVEPTGDSFDSIIKLDSSNRPHNAMINAGAIVIADMIRGDSPQDRLEKFYQCFESFIGHETLDLYVQQCAMKITTQDLALMGATLANKGKNPKTGIQAISPEYTRNVLSVMLTCGLYDYSGEWVYDVGLPAKTGVSGGTVVAIPGVGGLAIHSPRLDTFGNSVRGIKVCEDMSQELGLHIFDAEFNSLNKKAFMREE